jgi:mono/diheme cytochrome c family protein
MKRAVANFALLVTVGLAATSGASARRDPTAVSTQSRSHAARPSSFRTDVQPIFTTSCVMCHQDSVAMGGLSLQPSSARAMLVNVASVDSPLMRVAPGKPDGSYILHKLNATHVAVGGKGLPMPIGQAPITAAELAALRAWIAQGARDN